MPDKTTDHQQALQNLLGSLIRLALAPDAGNGPDWRDRAKTLQSALQADADIQMSLLDVNNAWNKAVKDAERDPDVQLNETVNPVLPMVSPLTIEALRSEEFDADQTTQLIRDTASFG